MLFDLKIQLFALNNRLISNVLTTDIQMYLIKIVFWPEITSLPEQPGGGGVQFFSFASV